MDQLKETLTKVLVPKLANTEQIFFDDATSWNLNWKYTLPTQRAYQTYTMFNDHNPDSIQQGHGGMVLWRDLTSLSKSGKYKIIIRDRPYLHLPSANHVDFLYLKMNIKLKPKTVEKIPLITASTTYNGVSQTIKSGCHFIGASIATIAVIKMLDQDELTLDQAKNAYSSYIGLLHKEYKELEDTGDISMENVKQHMPLTLAFDKYIFS